MEPLWYYMYLTLIGVHVTLLLTNRWRHVLRLVFAHWWSLIKTFGLLTYEPWPKHFLVHLDAALLVQKRAKNFDDLCWSGRGSLHIIYIPFCRRPKWLGTLSSSMLSNFPAFVCIFLLNVSTVCGANFRFLCLSVKNGSAWPFLHRNYLVGMLIPP